MAKAMVVSWPKPFSLWDLTATLIRDAGAAVLVRDMCSCMSILLQGLAFVACLWSCHSKGAQLMLAIQILPWMHCSPVCLLDNNL